MDYNVSAASIVCMAIALLAGIAIPLTLFLVLRKKYRANVLPFFIGVAVFVVFALGLEGLINSFIFGSTFGKTIQGNIWLYGAFGGLMAGLFEETGRFVAFKTVLKRSRVNDRNALMYGAGHGGFEALYILGVGMISNIVFSLMLNAGMGGTLTAGMTDAAQLEAMNRTFAALAATPPATFLMSVVERLAAVAFQISCSVLVWVAAKDGKRIWLYPLAVLLHALLDAMAVILAGHVSNVWIVLGAVYVFAAGSVALAWRLWKKYLQPKPDAAVEIN
jgi:uncharacterized membrane protein YhfC